MDEKERKEEGEEMKLLPWLLGYVGACFGLTAYIGLEIHVLPTLTTTVADTVRMAVYGVYGLLLASWLK